ncbi:MAG: hypothetical protein ACSLE0_12955 [Chitinophagaceae bacterium]
MNDDQATFGYDTKKVSLIGPDLKQKDFALKSKDEVAVDIVHEITSLLLHKRQQDLVVFP